jgi:endonuclease YncB( thermonuclease family)
MEELQRNINWQNIQNENASFFIPPIKYGKVVKVHSGDTFTIITKIPFFNETIENAPAYRFTISLDGITAPKVMMMMDFNNNGTLSKDALSKWINDKVIELCDVSVDKYGKIYANVYVDNIHINHWLVKHHFAIKNKNEKRRRMSETDSQVNNKTKCTLPHVHLKQDILLDSYFSSKKIDNFILPSLMMNDQNRPNTTSTSSIIHTHCFLSHNWGENKTNHENVKNINDALKKRGLNTWFDESKIDGNVRFKMAEGIDNTKCVVVFITNDYRNKVNSLDMKDNCKYEFTYAMNQLGSQNMIPVVMEPEMKETSKLKGELGAALGSMLYIDFTNIIDIEKKYDELYKRIQKVIRRESRKSNK